MHLSRQQIQELELLLTTHKNAAVRVYTIQNIGFGGLNQILPSHMLLAQHQLCRRILESTACAAVCCACLLLAYQDSVAAVLQ